MTQTLQSVLIAEDNSASDTGTAPVEITPQPRGFRYQDIIGLWPDLDERFEDYVREHRKAFRDREVLL